jgi:lipid-binding SYLF domain-containing protein
MHASLRVAIVFCGAIAALAHVTGCATAPRTSSEQQSLEARASTTLDEMSAREPALAGMLSSAAGYAVFPDIGKGGALVGGAFGRGVLFQGGQPVGFVKVEQASIGAQLGAQTFAELLVLPDDFAVERLKRGELTLGADVGAVVLTSGAIARAQISDGVQVFVLPRGGLMAELSLSGQRIQYEPRG